MTSIPTSLPSATPPSPASKSTSDPSTPANKSNLQREIQNLEAEENASYKHLKDTFERQYVTQQVASQSELDALKDKAEEEHRQLGRTQNNELREAKLQGEKKINEVKHYYQNQANNLNRKNQDQISEIEDQFQRIGDSEKRAHTKAIDDLNTENSEQVNKITTENKHLINELKKNKTALYDKLHNEHEDAYHRLDADIRHQVTTLQNDHQTIINNLKAQSDLKLEELQKKAIQTISSYHNQLDDPFYKSINFESHLSETDKEFILKVTIPEYEHKNITININGDRLTLAGYRQSKQEFSLEPQSNQSTSSFQSYNKTFHLTAPVEGKKLTRHSDGNHLTIRVPKRMS